MTSVWNYTQQTSPAAAEPVAFSQQLDEIDRALFEYRYRKQNQQYHVINNTNGVQGHNNNHQKHHKGGRNKNNSRFNGHHQHTHQQPQQYQAQFGTNPSRANYQLPSSVLSQGPNPVTTTTAQHYHPEPVFPLSAISPDPFNNMMSRSTTVVNSSSTSFSATGLVAHSPDSFLISDDYIFGSSKLSSSAISSGEASSSTSSSNGDFEISNKPGVPSTRFNLPNVGKAGMNGFYGGSFMFGNDGLTEFGQNSGDNVNFNAKHEKSPGWLNIWGSDMSVWG